MCQGFYQQYLTTLIYVESKTMKHFILYFFLLSYSLVIGQTITEVPILTGNDTTFAWGIVSNGTNYLVPIVGDETNINSLTFQLLSSNGTPIGTRVSLNQYGHIMAAHWDGTRYFIVAFHTDGTLYGYFVNTNGVVDGSPVFISNQASLKEGSQIISQIGDELIVLYRKNSLLYGQRVQKTGNLIGSPIQISISGEVKEYAIATNGITYFVAWFNKNSQSGNNAIYGRIINADGSMATDVFEIEAPNADHNPLSIAFDGTRYYLSYDISLTPTPGKHGIFGRFITTSGTVGNKITICVDDSTSNSISSVVYGNGLFLITWHCRQNMEEGDIFMEGQFINTNGEMVGNKFTISSPINGKFPLGINPYFNGNSFVIGFNRVRFSNSNEGQFTDGDVYVSFISHPTSDVNSTSATTPERYTVFQNYPNPFNAATTIQFSLPSPSFVSIKIYNTLGREVATIASGYYIAGTHNITWNAGNIASGLYFCRYSTADYAETKKFVLLK